MYVIYRVLHDMNQLCPFTGWLHEWVPPSAILKASFMRTPRKLIPIPPRFVAGIDKIAGLKQRTSFIVDLLEREIRRHDQIEALREGCGPVYDPSCDVLGSIVFKTGVGGSMERKTRLRLCEFLQIQCTGRR